MKVTLNVSEDKELREAVNQLIRGQFLSMTREIVQSVIQEETERLVKSERFTYQMQQYVREQLPRGYDMTKIIRESITTRKKEELESYARKVFMEEYSDARKMIEQSVNYAVEDKIKKLAVSVN